jgi:hypothetical protein
MASANLRRGRLPKMALSWRPFHPFTCIVDPPRVFDHTLRDLLSITPRISLAMSFEVLHGALVLLGRLPRGECPQIPALAGARVALPRIEAVVA